MSRYYCLLGNTPELSFAELSAILGAAQVESLSQTVAAIECADDAQAKELMKLLGGTVKITRHLADVKGQTPTQLEETLAETLSHLSERPTFGIGEWSRDHLPPLDTAMVKRHLSQYDKGARFIEGKRQGLSAAVLLHKSKVIELMVISAGTQVVIAQTVAVQDIDAWTIRDRAKPYANRRKGMLPPKVARMMLNLAMGAEVWQAWQTKTDLKATIYDPFCGTGTVLIEAAQLGARVVGSDLDAEAVAGTRKNIEWWQRDQRRQVDHWLAIGDVTHINVPPSFTPTAIVSEPFLGKQTPRAIELPNTFKGLEKLYLGAFKHWREILPVGGKIVIILPAVTLEGKTYTLKHLIDKLPDLGYTITSGIIEYHRPQAVVTRQITVITRTE